MLLLMLCIKYQMIFTDCADTHEDCEYWKENGYCYETEGQYSETRELCPRSCGVCTACSKEAEESHLTALPSAQNEAENIF